MKKAKVVEQPIQEVEVKAPELSCNFTDCWHYGACLYTDRTWGKHFSSKFPDINETTKKPKCFLAQDWFTPSKKKAAPSLEELEEAKKEAKRKKKEKESES